jgi:imidazolonepropionase-like amidohydrolase
MSMRDLRAKGSVACLLALTSMSMAPPAHAADLLIENVTIVSPERTRPLAGQSVLVRDGRIAQIGAAIKAPPGVAKLSGRGKFLTPGLMDSHVHLTTPPGLPLRTNDPTIGPLIDAFNRQQPRSYLYFGVTQVLDPAQVGNSLEMFEAQPQHPDLFRCGAAPVLDGYPTVFVDRAARYSAMPDYLYEPANAQQHPLPQDAKAQDHTPETIVDRIAASGAICVKVFIEDGFGPAAIWPVPSKDTLLRVRAAAHKRGLVLLAHANSLDMQRLALDARVDVLVHGLWNWDEADAKSGMPAVIAAHLRRIRDARVGYQPTLRVMAGTADLFRADTLEDPTYAKVVPTALLAWYASDAGQWFKREMKRDFGDLSDGRIASLQLQVGERGMRAVHHLHELGHPLLLGSDTPSAPTYGNQPGYDTYRELRLLAHSGVPLDAIFRAATLNNARQFHLEKEYGTVTIGKIANLLLLDADPLQSVQAWSRIDKVILRGTVIERDSLAADRK